MTAKPQTAHAAYLKAYARAMGALRAVEDMIHDSPTPDGDTQLNWGHVGDTLRVAVELEQILSES